MRSNNDENVITRKISIDDAIELIGIGKFQNTILFSAGLCFASDSIEISLLAFLSNTLKIEWGLSNTSAASMVSSVFAGAMLGTLTLGPLGDKRGRKPVYIISATLIGVFGLFTALANSYVFFLSIRFIVGFGVGGLTAPFDLLLEVLPGSYRGKYLLYIEFFWSLGSMFVPTVAWLSLNRSWRVFVILCALPCFLSIFIGWVIIPESPRWLLSQGRANEALIILRRAAMINGKEADVLFPLDQTQLTCKEVEDTGFSELFKPRWRKTVLLVWAAWFGMAFAYFGTVLVITRLFEVSNENATFDYSAIFMSSSAEIFGLLLVLPLVDRLGRVSTQIIFYTLGGLSLFVMCYYSTIHTVYLSMIAFAARSFEMGGTCVTWISTPEIFSTEIRSTGHSTANTVARLSAFISPYIVDSDLSLARVGLIMVAVHMCTVIVISFLPETSGSKLSVETELSEFTPSEIVDHDENDHRII